MTTTTAQPPRRLAIPPPTTEEHSDPAAPSKRRGTYGVFFLHSRSLGRKVRVRDLEQLTNPELRALLLEADSLVDHLSSQPKPSTWRTQEAAAFLAAVEAEITTRGEHRDLFRRVLAMEIGEEAVAAIEARVQALAAAQAAAEAT